MALKDSNGNCLFSDLSVVMNTFGSFWLTVTLALHQITSHCICR